ncbi:DNRLRE domain-containing protein [Enterocloster lavalensis]|uniref:DNRLRE domain-containing protein n=1 Tax=Enterocloster lavalensis TaxID=460384 RepID=UPI00140997C2|nr:DNRLRE domain-containing protein [Enterocloster lavalensis]
MRKSNRKQKRLLAKAVSLILTAAMVSPNVVPLIAYGAQAAGNRPRYVSFGRPEPLSLKDIGIQDQDTNPVNESSDGNGDRSGNSSGSEHENGIGGGSDREGNHEESDGTSENGTETGNESEAEGGTEHEGGTGGETGSGNESGTESGTEGESGSGNESGTEGETGSGNESETGGESGSGNESGTEGETGSGNESGTEGESGSGNESETGGESGSGNESETGGESGSGNESGSEGETGSENEDETGGENGSQTDGTEETDPSEEPGNAGGNEIKDPEIIPDPQPEPKPEIVPEQPELPSKLPEDIASPSEAELRAPEIFYEDMIDEPDGELVQFNDAYRTYETGEGSYTTVIGGYSGLYLDEDGNIESISNTFQNLDSDKLMEAQDEDRPITARMALLPSVYRNEAGPYTITVPKRMNSAGITITKDEYTLKIQPKGGDFSRSMASENAIRYSDVYENIDFQYTLVGNSLKEDIILLEPTEQNVFKYHISANGLKLDQDGNRVIAYDRKKSEPVFVVEAPAMIDAGGEASDRIKLNFASADGLMTLTADQEWLEDTDREYPVRIDPGPFVLTPSEFFYANVASGSPDKYFGDNGNSYVGYHDALKNCRVFMALGMNIASIMGQGGIVSATLSVGSQTCNGQGQTALCAYAPTVNWNATTLTWKTMPNEGQMGEVLDLQYVETPNGILSFDVTKAVEKWVTGQEIQAGFALAAQVEPSSGHEGEGKQMPYETIYNKSSSMYGPKLVVSWEGELPNTDFATMDINDLTAEVDAVVEKTGVNGRNALAVVGHGISQAGSEVSYEVVPADYETDNPADGPVTAENTAVYPDYGKAAEEVSSGPVVVCESPVKDGNWQSFALIPSDDIELNTIVRLGVKAVGQTIETGEDGEPEQSGEEAESAVIYTDDFLLYDIKQTDILTRIARHYGVSVNQLRTDNHIDFQLNEEGNILFIRNPETDEEYTFKPPVGLEKYLLDSYLNGVDFRHPLNGEPINMISGNFYMNQTDSELEELGGVFRIERSYNSKTPYFRSEFGMGWNSPWGERIMVLQDGTILYTDGSGRSLQFSKQEDGTYKAPAGYNMVLTPVDSIDIAAVGMDDETQPEENTELESGVLRASASNADKNFSSAAYKALDEDIETEDGEGIPDSIGWELEDAQGNVRVFNFMGLLYSARDRKGNTTTLKYDDEYTLVQVVSPSGKVFDITMDEDGRITQIGLPDGRSLSYEYDEAGDLVRTIDPEGSDRRYEYDDAHHMTAWYDENGSRVVLNVYDGEGRVTEQTDANGNTCTIEYGDGENTFTDNRGNDTVYVYDDQYRITQIQYADGTVEISEYTADNELASKTDANSVTVSFRYDEWGNVLSEIRQDGSSASFTYNELNLPLTVTDYEGNVTTYTYDEVGNLLTMTNGEGDTTSYAYDELNRLIAITDACKGVTSFVYEGNEAVPVACTDGEGHRCTYVYDEMNRLLKETDGAGNTTIHVYNANGWEISTTAPDGGVTAYEFSPAGEVISTTDALGTKTEFTYDPMHNILTGEDALGNTLTYAYDGNYNRVSETNAKGDVTGYTYDIKNRQIKITDAVGNEISMELDGNGNILTQTDRRGNATSLAYDPVLNLPLSFTDRMGAVTGYTYDRNGNLTGIAYPDGSGVSYSYDGAGRMTAMTLQNGTVTRMSYDGNGNIVRLSDDEDRVYSYAYDHNNRLVRAVDPLGGETRFSYDAAGRQIRMENAAGNGTDYTYDAVGRLTELKDALNGTVQYEYDLEGKLLKTTDQNGHAASWRYNVVGQALAQVDAAGNITAMEYDSLGNVTKVIDALKGETTAQMDALSRTVKVTDALGGIYEYTYDENGNLLKTVLPDGDTVSMSYDKENRMTYYRDEASVITRYEYDTMGRISKAQDTAGNIMIYEYDASGNLVKQTDTIGREAVYDYDAFNRLISVTGTDGATTTYGYDVLDRLISVTQADGTVTTYEYDAVGNLIKTTEPGEAVYTYAYDAINRLTGKVNPLGASTSFQYDAKGNLTSSTDGEGNTTSYAYDALDRLTTLTDGRGNSTAYEYDELSRLLSYTTPEQNKLEYRYDALSRLVKAKDPNGLITEYQYDSMGNLTQSISPKGAKTAYTYDKHDELTSVTDAAGNVTQYEVDPNRRVTKLIQKNGGVYQYTYDPVHRLTGIETPLGLEQSFTYDAADNIVEATDNLNRTTSYEYDIMHRMTKSTNPAGGVTAFGYDIRGNQNQMTNAMGHTWNYQYDLVDQLTKSVDPEGKATEAVYDLVGNLTSITTPGQRTTRYGYDQNYNRISMTDPKGYEYQHSFDKDNRQIGSKDPLNQTEAVQYDAGGRITSLTDKMGLSQEFTYDNHGNVLTSKATSGLITQFQYDILDNLTQVTDPMGNVTSYAYDVMGNLTSMTDAKLRVTEYTYDLEGNMTSLTSPMGRTEQYIYDAAGRMTQRITPVGNTIRYDYNTLNELVDKQYADAAGEEADHPARFVYNQMGQRIAMEDITGESGYTYDSLGRLRSAENGSGKTVEYVYDEADNLKGILYPDGKSVLYEYDKNDNITKLTDRDGRETTFDYDPLNRLTKVVRADGSVSSYTYNARNQVVEVENLCVCGFLISDYQYTYDDGGLIIGETAKECLFTSDKDYGHQGGPLDDCAHSEENPWNNQNPEWETTQRTFTYDDNGQLVKCFESKGTFEKYTYTYQYDEAGNRTLAMKQKAFTLQQPEKGFYTYNDDNQMVGAVITVGNLTKQYTFTYDANGNLTAECFMNCAEVSYQYDTENRLTAVKDPQKLLMAAAYDGDGNRAFQLNYNPEAVCGYGKNVSGEIYMPENSKNEDGSLTAEGELFSYICSATGRAYDLTEYVNDTNRRYTEVLTAYTVNSQATESYSYAGNMRISRNNIWTEARGVVCDQTSYYLYDGRGSVTANTWYNGMVTNVYQYDPYGQVTLGSTAHTDFYGYNAESYNPNTGLEYLRARYYNPNKGRFFQEDTYLGNIINPLTLNRYAYVVNSPLNYVDPSGYDPRDAWDRPDNHIPDNPEQLGSFWNTWSFLYGQADSTDLKWRLIDLKDYYFGAYGAKVMEGRGSAYWNDLGQKALALSETQKNQLDQAVQEIAAITAERTADCIQTKDFIKGLKYGFTIINDGMSSQNIYAGEAGHQFYLSTKKDVEYDNWFDAGTQVAVWVSAVNYAQIIISTLGSFGAFNSDILKPSPKEALVMDSSGNVYTMDVADGVPATAEKVAIIMQMGGEKPGDNEGDSDSKIPQKAKEALDKIDKDPDSYLEDYNGNYPFRDQPNKAKGETKIPNPNVATYTEWDINPYKYGQNRGTERIVTGSDGSAWYTPDHYKTWYQIR